ncbi:MAG TPA: histidine kinase [Caulobacteraceae bacterium]|jgi:hypothetical protein|nr:histidine kinase [Caulobacteraceae bacterium]
MSAALDFTTDATPRRWTLGRLVREPLFLTTVTIWALSAAFWTIASLPRQFDRPVEVALRGSTADTLGAILCGVMYLVLRRIQTRPLAFRFTTALALSLVGVAIYMVYAYWIYYVLAPMGVGGGALKWCITHLDAAVAVLWTFLAWCGVYFSLQLGAELRATQAKAADAQNRMLRYQLDPQFLFNIHNALSALIHRNRNADAEHLVLTLSRFLRRSLEKDPRLQVPLAEEISAMRDYIGVERARIGERLRFVEAIQPQVQDAMAPSFILQPLLEHAIRQGLADDKRPITIELGAHKEGDHLKLWVWDDTHAGSDTGRLADPGLEFVRSRLETLYGPTAGMATETTEPGGSRTVLTIPLGYS